MKVTKPQINDTTRRFPNTMREAFGDNYYDLERHQRWEWMEGHKSDAAAQAEFWVYIACAFACGFLTHILWG